MTNQKLAMVTGGAKRVGKAVCLHLALQGFDIVLHYHSSSTEANKTAAEIKVLGSNVYLVQADLGNETEIKSMFEQVSRIGVLNVLINAASTMPKTKLLEPSQDRFAETLNINLYAPWKCAVLAAKLMSNGGSIINFSDVGAHKLWTAYPEYVFSKNGVEILTRMLAKKLAPSVRVNAIAPGLLMKADSMPIGEWDRLKRKVPLQRSVPIEDLLASIDFLLGNEYVTGEILDLSGGDQVAR